MRRLGAVVVSVTVLAGCANASADQLACDLTLQMGNEVESGAIAPETAQEFIDIAPDVEQPELRAAAGEVASDLAADPSEALDSLATLFDRCAQLGHFEKRVEVVDQD